MEATDFQRVIKDLEAAGLTHQDIAEKAGVTRGFISQLSRRVRTSPSYDVGKRLLALRELMK